MRNIAARQGAGIFMLFIVSFLHGCINFNKEGIIEIKTALHNTNRLKIEMSIICANSCGAFVEYWPVNSRAGKFVSLISANKRMHTIVLTNILPDTKYFYQVTTIAKKGKEVSKIYEFKSNKLPSWLQEQTRLAEIKPPARLPEYFTNGFLLMNKQQTPGMIYITDTRGNLRWYHTIDNTGFKVSHFTKEKTILSILGTADEPTSYGSEILEINLQGDTVLYLKKGRGDLNKPIHHEILKHGNGRLATIFVDTRVVDLSSIGGKPNDTVTGDGIMILDSNGKAVWTWSVFDVADPKQDPKILSTKADWVHANSLCYDTDSAFLISFYNTGQIWKIDPKTGHVVWKMGSGGNITSAQNIAFSQSHAVHVNKNGHVMFFDNGVERKQSQVFALKIRPDKKASVGFNFKLPKNVYNERMGSAYLVNDSLVLSCCSKRFISVLSNIKGEVLWGLHTVFAPYRTVFIPATDLAPFIYP